MDKSLYIFESGVLYRRESTLCVERDGKKSFYPVKNIESIFIFGSVFVNTSLISFLNKNKIYIFYFDYFGNFIGEYEPFGLRDYSIRMNQYEASISIKKRNHIVLKILESEKHNMLSFLKHYARSKKISFNDLDDIRNFSFSNNKNMMFEEAILWRKFYTLLKKIVKGNFDSRKYNPPNSEINSLISFLNGLLYSLVLREIFKTNLDNQISFLHSSRYKRNSLVYDIADIYKPYITFSLLTRLLNLNIIKKSDFSSDFFIKKSIRRKIVSEFNNFCSKTYFFKNLNRYVSLRYLIRYDLYSLMNYINGKGELSFFKKWW